MLADKKTGEEADGGRRGPDFDFDDVLENIGGFGKYQARFSSFNIASCPKRCQSRNKDKGTG